MFDAVITTLSQLCWSVRSVAAAVSHTTFTHAATHVQRHHLLNVSRDRSVNEGLIKC